ERAAFVQVKTAEEFKGLVQKPGRRLESQLSPQAYKSQDVTLPHPEDLRDLGVPEPVVKAMDAVAAKGSHGLPLYYRLNPALAIPQWIDDTARTVAWTIPAQKLRQDGSRMPGLGKRIREEVTMLVNPAKAPLHAFPGENNAAKESARTARMKIMAEDKGREAIQLQEVGSIYVPLLMGGMTGPQAAAARTWHSARLFLADKADTMLKARNPITGKTLIDKSERDRVIGHIRDSPALSFAGVNSGLTSLFYSSALGLNMSPVAKNLMQNFVTMADVPSIHRIRGVDLAARDMGRFLELKTPRVLGGQGLETRQAIEQASPEFARAFQDLDSLQRDVAIKGMDNAAADAFGRARGTVKSGIKKWQRVVMGAFGTTELWNRLHAWHSFKDYGRKLLPGKKFFRVDFDTFETIPRRGPHLDEALNLFASAGVERAAFTGGILGRPRLLVDKPALLTQFTTFPLRLAALGFSDARMFARMALASQVAFRAVEQFTGEDIGEGLFFGGLPLPQDRGSFGPIPIVPPGIQVLAAPFEAAATGSFDPILKSLPLGVPGGVATVRALAFGGIGEHGQPAIPKFLGKSHADYSNPLPDGRVPVFTGSGSLQGYFTKAQLLARAFGVPIGQATATAERNMTRWLLAQRDNVRGIKREYLQALYDNDGEHALQLHDRFERQYPGLGGIPVTRTELRSIHLRKDVSRLERVLESLPADLRSEFEPVLAGVLGASYPGLLGLNPPGLSSGNTIREREVHRMRSPGETASRVQRGRSLHGVKFNQKARAAGIETAGQRADQIDRGHSFSPFQGFR
ncbi:hypothetical protein LCGC14_1196380, partial [marine sediment metagenome]